MCDEREGSIECQYLYARRHNVTVCITLVIRHKPYMGIQVGWFFMIFLFKEMKPKLGIIPLPVPTYFRCLVMHIHTVTYRARLLGKPRASHVEEGKGRESDVLFIIQPSSRYRLLVRYS
jgi:hypothetical protein